MSWERFNDGQLAFDRHFLSAAESDSSLEERFAEAYPLIAPLVHRHLLLIVRDTQEAEDLTHEAFLRLFEQLRQGKEPDDWRSWLLKVARNLALDRLRKKSPGQLDDELLATLAAPSESDLLASERLRQVHEALAVLSPQERVCLELRAEGMKYREIASAAHVSISTVQTALERAIKKLTRFIHD